MDRVAKSILKLTYAKTSPVLSVVFRKFNTLNIMPLKNGKEAYLLGMINKEGSGTHCSPWSPILGCEWCTLTVGRGSLGQMRC